jgi:hypothetical protein
MILEFSRQIFEKCYNAEFNEKPSSGRRVVVVACRRTDMTEAILAPRNFANSPKKFFIIRMIQNTQIHLVDNIQIFNF